MARITVEDCLEVVPNRFSLVLVAAERTKQLLKGAHALINNDSDNKEVVTALREIAAGHFEIDDSEVLAGRLRISGAAHRVWYDSVEVELTPLEFKILASLAKAEGRVWTRDKLLHEVWGGLAVTSRTIDTHVRRLREKLGEGGDYIQTCLLYTSDAADE